MRGSSIKIEATPASQEQLIPIVLSREMDSTRPRYFIPTYQALSTGTMGPTPLQYNPYSQQLGQTAQTYFEKLQDAKRKKDEKKFK